MSAGQTWLLGEAYLLGGHLDKARRVLMTRRPGPGPGDPVGALLALMARLEPALAPAAVLAALSTAAARPDGRRRIAAAVTAQPELLIGQGARAPIPGVLRFISVLARAGATAVVEPRCPRCGRQRQLGDRSKGYGSAEGAGAKPARCSAAGAATILAKTLGIHIQVAAQWQKIAAGDWATYAADISRRGHAQELAGQPADPFPGA